MKSISAGWLSPSAAIVMDRRQIRHYSMVEKLPEVGDLIYGRVHQIGFHEDLENSQGRIHHLNKNTRAIFVFGTRYAPDVFEGILPVHMEVRLDLLARSGIVGKVSRSNDGLKEPTKIQMLGYVVDDKGPVLNTRQFPKIAPKTTEKKEKRGQMTVVVGTSMNAGKSLTAAAICWALSSVGKRVIGSKLTGTASLKDILRMEDAGASAVSDFSFFGHPSTYLLDPDDLVAIFDKLDLRFVNNPTTHWVVELADGVLQRETRILLSNERFRQRIGKLILAGRDSFSVLGCIDVLQKEFGLTPDAISGIAASSPLFVEEIMRYRNIPLFSNRRWDLEPILEVVLM